MGWFDMSYEDDYDDYDSDSDGISDDVEDANQQQDDRHRQQRTKKPTKISCLKGMHGLNFLIHNERGGKEEKLNEMRMVTKALYTISSSLSTAKDRCQVAVCEGRAPASLPATKHCSTAMLWPRFQRSTLDLACLHGQLT